MFSPGDASDVTSYDAAWLVDAEATLTFNDNYKVTIGGENIFDEEPDKEAFPGVANALTSPFGFNGGFWYVRLAADF